MHSKTDVEKFTESERKLLRELLKKTEVDVRILNQIKLNKKLYKLSTDILLQKMNKPTEIYNTIKFLNYLGLNNMTPIQKTEFGKKLKIELEKLSNAGFASRHGPRYVIEITKTLAKLNTKIREIDLEIYLRQALHLEAYYDEAFGKVVKELIKLIKVSDDPIEKKAREKRVGETLIYEYWKSFDPVKQREFYKQYKIGRKFGAFDVPKPKKKKPQNKLLTQKRRK